MESGLGFLVQDIGKVLEEDYAPSRRFEGRAGGREDVVAC